MTPAATRFVGPLTLPGALRRAGAGGPARRRRRARLRPPRSSPGWPTWSSSRPPRPTSSRAIRAGMADDAVTTTLLAATCPVLLAPAMNTRMWRNPAVQENLAALRARGFHVVGPAAGELADGDVGEGRLADPAEIAAAAARLLGRPRPGRPARGGHRRTDPRAHRPGALHLEPLDREDGLRGRGGGGAPRRRGDPRLRPDATSPTRPAWRWSASRRPRRWRARWTPRPGAMDLFVGAAAVSDYRPRAAAPPEDQEAATRTRRWCWPGRPTSWPGWARATPGSRARRCWWASPPRPRTSSRTRGRSSSARGATSWSRTRWAARTPASGPTRTACRSCTRTELAEVEGTKEKVAEAILDSDPPRAGRAEITDCVAGKERPADSR